MHIHNDKKLMIKIITENAEKILLFDYCDSQDNNVSKFRRHRLLRKIFLSENSLNILPIFDIRCYSCLLIRKSRTFGEGNASVSYHA